MRTRVVIAIVELQLQLSRYVCMRRIVPMCTCRSSYGCSITKNVKSSCVRALQPVHACLSQLGWQVHHCHWHASLSQLGWQVPLALARRDAVHAHARAHCNAGRRSRSTYAYACTIACTACKYSLQLLCPPSAHWQAARCAQCMLKCMPTMVLSRASAAHEAAIASACVRSRAGTGSAASH